MHNTTSRRWIYSQLKRIGIRRNRGNRRNHSRGLFPGVYLTVKMRPVKLDSIPEDILIHILLFRITVEFELTIGKDPMSFLLNISHTNRALRKLALSTPCLWSTLSIVIDYSKSCCESEHPEELRPRCDGLLNLFRLWIGRSGDSPLNYEFIICTGAQITYDVFELFLREKNRWKSMSFYFDVITSYTPVFQFELTDMPCLQNFKLISSGTNPMEKGIDLSKSTQLRCLYLHPVDSSQWRTIMETIHTQQLTELYLGLTAARTLAVVDPNFLTSLGTFTNLKRLKFDLYEMDRSESDVVWSGPPVVLPNLTMLVLGEFCGKLMKYLTTPSLVSLSIHTRKDDGSYLHSYLRRSNSPLEIMQGVYGERRGLFDFWSCMSVKDSSTVVLLPKLMELHYNIPHHSRDMDEEVILLAQAVLSRKNYSEDFHFHLHGSFEFSADFPHHNKILLYSTIDECDVYRDHCHLAKLFDFT
ncbi:hypothetical protein PNOK_0934000 [Pyrrhoderma noxium]|uniref:Uncharacterized protein n=1 Tax=Pyrrhoderma noxium TaxID=2282107 RepID=A0A286U5E9_9AGAM|nr:hypothetical protein PNOK_0934000 [Pyrrhoderma noxium]